MLPLTLSAGASATFLGATLDLAMTRCDSHCPSAYENAHIHSHSERQIARISEYNEHLLFHLRSDEAKGSDVI
jgi:hypothetical protein